MKRILVSLAMVFTTNTVFSQSVFDKYEDKDGVTSVIVNKKMFEMMSRVKVDAKDKDAQQFFNLIKRLDNLKVFTTTDAKMASDMKGTMANYLKSNPLDELMRTTQNGKKVNIYVKSGASENTVKELLMNIDSSGEKGLKSVILSLTGNFNLDEISLLTERMNLPGGDELKKVSKK